MAFSDLTALTPQQLDDVCKWLLSRVVMFSGDIYDCAALNLSRKFDLVGTVGGYALMVNTDWRQFLKVTCITHCDLVCVEPSYLPDAAFAHSCSSIACFHQTSRNVASMSGSLAVLWSSQPWSIYIFLPLVLTPDLLISCSSSCWAQSVVACVAHARNKDVHSTCSATLHPGTRC